MTVQDHFVVLADGLSSGQRVLVAGLPGLSAQTSVSERGRESNGILCG